MEAGALADLPLAGAPVTVMGLGLFGGGLATVRWLRARGARVTVTDLRGADVLAPALAELDGLPELDGPTIRTVLGHHERADFEDAALVIANPAVPPSSPYLQRARAAGVPVSSELELVLVHARQPLVLVTGTHGKSSTVHFATQLLAGAGLPAVAGGNIGAPLLDRLDSLAPDTWCVVEASSYQLEALAGRGPFPAVRGAAITNVLADHLERHGTPEAYRAAKLELVRLLTPGCWLLADPELPDLGAAVGEGLRLVPVPAGGIGRGPADLAWASGTVQLAGETLGDLHELRLPGPFQRENAARALALARLAGAPVDGLRAAVGKLRGLPHRLEDLGLHAGRRVIDNGVSTTPESTLAALEALPELGPGSVLLCGGRAKSGLDYAALARAVAQRGAAMLCFGADGALLAGSCAAAGAEHGLEAEFVAAARAALERTARGAILCFSPACASFDAFPNFRARAETFRSLLPGPDA